jgi:hypothetical protein
LRVVVALSVTRVTWEDEARIESPQ